MSSPTLKSESARFESLSLGRGFHLFELQPSNQHAVWKPIERHKKPFPASTVHHLEHRASKHLMDVIFVALLQISSTRSSRCSANARMVYVAQRYACMRCLQPVNLADHIRVANIVWSASWLRIQE